MRDINFIFLLLIFNVVNAIAHPGGYDSEKCHVNRKENRRHCHKLHPSIPDDNPLARLVYEKKQKIISKYLSSKKGEFVDTIYSSWIKGLTYFKSEEILIVEFIKSQPIIHANFPWNMWELYKKAPSKGSFYNRYLKQKQRFKYIP